MSLKRIFALSVLMLGLPCVTLTTAMAQTEAPVTTEQPSSPPATQTAYIVMDEAAQAEKVTKLRPTSFTGSLTSISFDMGTKVRDSALKHLTPVFPQGLAVNTQAQAGAYNLSVKIAGFSYKYDQLSSLGMNITPRVSFTLLVDFVSPDGKVLFTKSYQRTNFDAGSYVATFKPKEKVFGAFDAALADVYSEITADIKNAMSSQPTSPAVTTPVVPDAAPTEPPLEPTLPAATDSPATTPENTASPQ